MAALILLAAALCVALFVLLILWPGRASEPQPVCPHCGSPLAECERAEECEVCGLRCASNVVLTSTPRRRVVDGMVGGSSISATFCRPHLPG